MTEQVIVAHVQVRSTVRRPVTATTFLAHECEDSGAAVRVRGHWRGHAEPRSYTWPWSSLVAVRWFEEPGS